MNEEVPILASPDFQAFMKNVFAQANLMLVKSIVPLAASLDGQAVFNRTGILLRVGARSFVVTAKHGTSHANHVGDVVDK
ncbi:MAG: hypothetical protein KDA61_04870, partial [Planctomycetales bacterium]|nr:hypothetical protein [Planctomycetales bacterium]